MFYNHETARDIKPARNKSRRIKTSTTLSLLSILCFVGLCTCSDFVLWEVIKSNDTSTPPVYISFPSSCFGLSNFPGFISLSPGIFKESTQRPRQPMARWPHWNILGLYWFNQQCLPNLGLHHFTYESVMIQAMDYFIILTSKDRINVCVVDGTIGPKIR